MVTCKSWTSMSRVVSSIHYSHMSCTSHTGSCEKKPQTPTLKLDILGTSSSDFRASWENFFLRIALELMISRQLLPHPLGSFTWSQMWWGWMEWNALIRAALRQCGVIIFGGGSFCGLETVSYWLLNPSISRYSPEPHLAFHQGHGLEIIHCVDNRERNTKEFEYLVRKNLFSLQSNFLHSESCGLTLCILICVMLSKLAWHPAFIGLAADNSYWQRCPIRASASFHCMLQIGWLLHVLS